MTRVLRDLAALLGSYGLAVAIFAGMFVLTLLGTLAQADIGLYEALQRYFYAWVAWQPIDPAAPWPLSAVGALPLPGGLLLMSLLALNLATGGLVRIRKSARTAGVIVVHLGIALLLAAGLVKLTLADDGYLALIEGEASDEFVSHYDWEVAIHAAGAVEDVEELLVEDRDLEALAGGASRRFRHPSLPFELELHDYVPNALVLPVGPMWDSGLPAIDGYRVQPLPRAQEAEANVAALHARALVDGAVAGESILWGAEAFPWTVAVGDEVWAVSLRKRRFKMPFTVRLDDFHMEEHPRTGIASLFRSDITKLAGDSEQRVRISMNRPLRDGGLVLFQTSYGQRPTPEGPRLFSQFSIVRNPSDHWPLYACIVISIGLLLVFGQRLTAYVRSQSARRQRAAEARP